MIKKEVGLKLFLGIFLLVILSSGVFAVEEGKCDVVLRSECTNDDTTGYIVMGLSSETNAHGEIGSSGAYPYVLCCNFGEGDTTCNEGFNSNKIIGLSAITNAHAEGDSLTNYQQSVCYQSIQCELSTSCDADENEILSLTSTTNAHIGGAGDYPNKVCCTKESMERTICKLTSVNWTNSEGNVISTSTESNEVRMKVVTSSCFGRNISLQVYEKKTWGGDDLKDTFNVMIGATNIIQENLENKDVGSIYYFIANLTSSEENKIQSGELEIKGDEYPIENNFDACEDYINKDDCESDIGNVAKEQVETMFEENYCQEYDCGCFWDSEDKTCSVVWASREEPNVCGNGEVETGEQCDLGAKNGDALSGCSNTCEYVELIPPCLPGFQLCTNRKCSLNCEVSDGGTACNYDGVCNSNEGCGCKDCDGKEDLCQTGLLCNIEGLSCCNEVSDGICNNPACTYADPDCVGVCGDGELNYGEQCDLGAKNGDALSGCSSDCKLEEINPIDKKCSEGLSLCNNGKCSLNCFATDAGIDPICKTTTGCCESDLYYSLVDSACCDPNMDEECNPNCRYMDPDCLVNPEIQDPFKCKITQKVTNDCDDEPLGRKTVIWTGEWLGEETSGEDYDRCVTGGESQIQCAAKLQLPFFDYIEFIIAIVIIAIIYTAVIYTKKNKKKKRKNKK